MTRLKQIFISLVFAVVLLNSPQMALANEKAPEIDGYTKPSLSNFLKTLIRFGAVSIKTDDVIDAYGRVTECKIYLKYFYQDFDWQRVRKALRDSIKMNVKTFPTAYYYDAELQLGRFDFKEGLYRFTDKTAQNRINVFTMKAHDEELCVLTDYDFPPLEYRFVLSKPVQLEGIPMSKEEGHVLLERMLKNKNKDRIVYVRFKFRVTYIAGLSEEAMGGIEGGRSLSPMVRQENTDAFVSLDSQLDAIEYYEDEARKSLIYRQQF